MSKYQTRAQTAEEIAQNPGIETQPSVPDVNELLQQIQEINERFERLQQENQKQNVIIELKDKELQRLGELKAVDLISNPSHYSAKKDSANKKETIKNSPFELNKMPLKF